VAKQSQGTLSSISINLSKCWFCFISSEYFITSWNAYLQWARNTSRHLLLAHFIQQSK
jgi:hypothetical protein